MPGHADPHDDQVASPAERYAASRARAAHPVFAEFEGLYDFGLDDFQVREIGRAHV